MWHACRDRATRHTDQTRPGHSFATRNYDWLFMYPLGWRARRSLARQIASTWCLIVSSVLLSYAALAVVWWRAAMPGLVFSLLLLLHNLYVLCECAFNCCGSLFSSVRRSNLSCRYYAASTTCRTLSQTVARFLRAFSLYISILSVCFCFSAAEHHVLSRVCFD